MVTLEQEIHQTNTLEELGYEPYEYESCDKEVYVDFILKSNSPIEVQYG